VNNMESIGAAMIVKNEESCLGDCLQSIVGLDEIVVLDTGSTDKTEEVAAKYPCKFIGGVYEWNDSFAEARNKAKEYATADWLLVIDADEVLVGGVDPLRSAVKKHKEAEAFRFKTVSLKNQNEVHESIRMHKNKTDIMWHGAIHNYLSVNDGPKMDGAEIHYGYSAAHQNDPDRALRILSKVVRENPKCVREKYYLAREFWYRNDPKMAIYYWEYYLETAYWGPEMADAHMMLARAYLSLGDASKAKSEALQAIALNANFREALRFMAKLSGPGNAKRWNAFADSATNEGILFVRGE